MSHELSCDKDFITQVGQWWQSLSRHQRGMLVAAHHLHLYGVPPAVEFDSLNLQAQSQIALRVAITMGIAKMNPPPDIPDHLVQEINGLPDPHQRH